MTTATIRKPKNRSFAIHAALAAMPPNPKNAATRARMKNINAQRSMIEPPPKCRLKRRRKSLECRRRAGSQLPHWAPGSAAISDNDVTAGHIVVCPAGSVLHGDDGTRAPAALNLGAGLV